MSDDHSPEAIKKKVRSYMFVGGALLLLTLVTVLASYVHFGAADSNAANITVGLIIATVKASLVAAVFMHLSSEKWTIYRFLLLTLFFAAGLFILTLFAHSDPIRL